MHAYSFRNILIIILGLVFMMESHQAVFANNFENPLATMDQRALDQLAIDIYQKYSFKPLRSEATLAFKTAYGKRLSQEAAQLLDGVVDEIVFSAIQKAVNSDPYYPKIYWVNAAPRQWFGLNVFGGRYAYDNPDAIYRTIPIDGNLHYVIHGRRHVNGLADVTFSLIENVNSQKTIAILTCNELVLSPDGTYEITIDNTPANGRINHIQSTQKAQQLFIRNNFGDWHDSVPDTLSVRLLDNVVGHAPQSEGAVVTNARKNIQESILDYAVGALGIKTMIRPVNTLSEPSQSDKLGTLITQASSFGHFAFDEDHALVVTLNPGGASYFVMPVTGPWTITLDPGLCQCSLNNVQAEPNGDGNYRFVVSLKDPGIHNWVSTCGLHEGTIMVRWQNLPAVALVNPSVSTQLVALADLASVLPMDTRWVTAVERKKQLSRRLESYLQRSQV